MSLTQFELNQLKQSGASSDNFVVKWNNSTTKWEANTLSPSNITGLQEQVEDWVGALIQDSSTLDFTYNDAGGALTGAVITQLSLTSDASGVKLVNDTASPGNKYVYGTNGSGTKGWFSASSLGYGNGIYGSSGQIAEGAIASLATSQEFRIQYSNGTNGFYMSDSIPWALIASRNYRSIIQADNNYASLTGYNVGGSLHSDIYVNVTGITASYKTGQSDANGLTLDSTGVWVTSTTKMFHPPNMTTTQKNAIASPANSGILFDTTLGKFQFREGGAWVSLGSGSGGLTDGDYGDIVVSGTGTVMTIDALAVTNSKVNDVSVAKLTSGTLATGLAATVPATSNFYFKYNTGANAFNVSTLSGLTSMASPDGTQIVSASDTSVIVASGTTQAEYIDGVLRLYDSDVSNYVGITVPATGTLTANYTLTLPSTAGTSGQGLSTNGTGTLSWASFGDVFGQASSVDSEIALFSGTGGKTIKRATGTGVAIVTSGVLSTKTNPSGAFVGDTDTQTISAKRITPRVTDATIAATITPDGDGSDLVTIRALNTNLTLAAPSGTPVQGQRLMIRIKDNNIARTLTWNSIYRALSLTLPSTTTVSKTMYCGFMYNSTDSKWDFIGFTQEL